MLHWPQLCSDGELILKNNTADELSIWLQKFSETLAQETEIKLGANATVTLALDKITSEERYSILNFNSAHLIETKYKCNQQVFTTGALEGGVLTFKKSDLAVNKLWLQNLFTGENKVEIEYQDSQFKKMTTENISLKSSVSSLYSSPQNIKNWSYVKITTSHKASVFNLTSSGHEPPIKVTPQTTVVDTAANYFLVGPRKGRGDSFIVKINDSALAFKARDLIANPQKEKMLFASIQKDHQGFNRNWSKTEKSFWSWSTSEVTNFADIGSTACNGSPQEIEDRIDFWVNDPGQICFWNYRVKKELSPAQVENGL
ncbi:MAG: hypothetical protein AABY53_03790 [Bdellovibrionota bacterium]